MLSEVADETISSRLINGFGPSQEGETIPSVGVQVPVGQKSPILAAGGGKDLSLGQQPFCWKCL